MALLSNPSLVDASLPHTRRIDYIDGIRGIAACSVVFQHTIEFMPFFTLAKNGPATFEPLELFNFGRFGVIIFFFVSGYLIPNSLAMSTTISRTAALREFGIGRFFRLYPLYWASLISTIIVYWSISRSIDSGFVVAANFTMFQMFFGIKNVLEPYWTLFVEMIFYLACVSLFSFGLLGSKKTVKFIVVAIAMSIFFGSAGSYLLWSIGHTSLMRATFKFCTFEIYLLAMFSGHLLRTQESTPHDEQTRWTQIFAILSLIAYSSSRSIIGVFDSLLTPTAVFLSTFCAAVLFLFRAKISVFRAKPMRILGDLSYGIYLFHPLTLSATIYLMGRPLSLLDSVQLLAAVFLSTIFVSLVLHHLVERPFIRLGKRLKSKSPQQLRSYVSTLVGKS